jgi:hypothetical protein
MKTKGARRRIYPMALMPPNFCSLVSRKREVRMRRSSRTNPSMKLAFAEL